MATSQARAELKDMKAKQIITLIVGITSVALSPIAWAAGHGGGGGFAGGGGHFGGGGFHGGGFSGVGHAAGGAGARGGGVGFGGMRGGGIRAAPYRYGGTHFADRSFGGPTGAFRYYNGGSRTSAARTYQFSGRGNQSMKSYAGRNATVARQQNRPASLTRQNMRTSNAQSAAAVRRTMANHRVFARHDGNWHHDWDRHHAHFDHGHVFVFTDGFWWGLYPWDYYPYDAYGSYPSDYYGYPYGYDDYPYDTSDSYTQNPYSYYNGYAGPAQSSNGVVSSVQSQLAKRGYYRGAVDGVLGDQTEAAIARYQEDNDLSVTGVVTVATLQSLGLAAR
jgi:Putative peptidoglycan binding domain